MWIRNFLSLQIESFYCDLHFKRGSGQSEDSGRQLAGRLSPRDSDFKASILFRQESFVKTKKRWIPGTGGSNGLAPDLDSIAPFAATCGHARSCIACMAESRTKTQRN